MQDDRVGGSETAVHKLRQFLEQDTFTVEYLGNIRRTALEHQVQRTGLSFSSARTKRRSTLSWRP
jgi:hypothetical protein